MTVTRRDALIATGAGAAAAGLTLASATASTAAPAEITPPDSYPLRLPDMRLRDPWIVTDAASGHYYLYTSNVAALTGAPLVGTMVYRSQDLQQWSTPEAVFQVTPDLWGVNGGWAPEVHRWKGRWYLFVTLHNPTKPLAVPARGPYGIPVQTPQFQRGTVIAVSDSLMGPFAVIDPTQPVAPATFMTLDGHLFKDDAGKPWMVYAHEWVQKIDGTIEAVPLKDDLSGAAGKPIHLFKGSDATWVGEEMPSPSANQIAAYVTDGPEIYRLPGGALAMLWSTFEKNINNVDGTVSGHYVQTSAVSRSGKLKGPWVQQRPLLRHDTGHGMIFRTLPTDTKPAQRMLIAHHGVSNAHAKLWEIELRRDGLRLGKHRKDLDGAS